MTFGGLSFDDFMQKLVNAKPKLNPEKRRKRRTTKTKKKSDG
jgi:hypothetical protein